MSGATQQQPPLVDIVVLGGCVADTIHRALATSATAASMLGTSTPCSSTTSFGGVGRNIAETCSRLSLRVALVSAVAADPLGSALVKHAQSVCGIDVRHVTVVPLTTATATSSPGVATAAYTAILDGKGELCAASAVMNIFDSHLLPLSVLFFPGATSTTASQTAQEGRDDRIDSTYFARVDTWRPWLRHVLPTAKWLVVDGNVPEVTVTALLRVVRSREWEAIRLQRWSAAAAAAGGESRCSSPPRLHVAYDPISTTKCLRVLPSLSAVDLIKPNLLELTAMSDAVTGAAAAANAVGKERTTHNLHGTAVALLKTLSRTPVATAQQAWADVCATLGKRGDAAHPAGVLSPKESGETWALVLFQTVCRAMQTLLAITEKRFGVILCTLGPLGVAVGRWQVHRVRAAGADDDQNKVSSPTTSMATIFLEDGPQTLSSTAGTARAATSTRSRPTVQFFAADNVPSSRIRKVTGAGDAFLSGYLYAAVRGGRNTAKDNRSACGEEDDEEGHKDSVLMRRIHVAKACAALALQASDTVPSQLDHVLLASRL